MLTKPVAGGMGQTLRRCCAVTFALVTTVVVSSCSDAPPTSSATGSPTVAVSSSSSSADPSPSSQPPSDPGSPQPTADVPAARPVVYVRTAGIDSELEPSDESSVWQCGAQRAAEKAGTRFEVAKPTRIKDRDSWDAAADAELEKIVATSPTAVLVDTSSSRSQLSTTALRAARAAGVRVVLIDSGREEDVAGAVYQPLAPLAEPVVDRIAADHPTGRVLVLVDLRSGDQSRVADAFAAHPELVAVAGPTGISDPGGQQRVRAAVESNLDVEAIIVDGSDTAVTVRAALAAGGRTKQVDLWALGGDQDAQDAVEAGTMAGFVGNTPVTVGAKAVDVALGTQQSVQVTVSPLVVTRQSLQQFQAAASC